MKKMLYALGTLFVLLQVVMGVRMDAFAKTYTQNISSKTKVTYTYEMEKGSSTDVAITKVEISNPTTNMTLTMPESITETVSGKTRSYKIVRICDAAFSTGSARVYGIKFPMSLKYLEKGSIDGAYTTLTNIYVPETLLYVHEKAFDTAKGGYGKITGIYLRKSSSSDYKIDSPEKLKGYMDKVIVKVKENDDIVVCDKNGNETKNGIIELFNALDGGAYVQGLIDKYATTLANQIVPAGTAEPQKLMLIYNYLVTHVRYGALYSGSDKMFSATHTPFGAFFLNLGVCSAQSDAFYMLAKKAGVKNIVSYCATLPDGQSHKWILYSPGSNEPYSHIDTCNCVCMGPPTYVNVIEKKDVNKYPIRKGYYGNCLAVKVVNNSHIPFDINIYDTDHADRKYINYTANEWATGKAGTTKSILKNNDQFNFVESNAYYSIKISQDSKVYFKEDILFNHAQDCYKTSFKDKNGTKHDVTVERKIDGDKATEHGCTYVVTIK